MPKTINSEITSKKKRINELESLRGVLALWVVVGHILPSAGILDTALGPFKFVAKGEYAVDVFIIMSGFFIFYLLDTAQEKYRPFIIRRFLRLFPAYFVCLIISILMINVSVETLSSLDWQHPQNAFRIQVFNDAPWTRASFPVTEQSVCIHRSSLEYFFRMAVLLRRSLSFSCHTEKEACADLFFVGDFMLSLLLV
jgi:hypothetical protein